MKTSVQLFNSSRKFKIVQIYGAFRLQRIKTDKKAKNVEIRRVLWFDASLTSERTSLPTF